MILVAITVAILILGTFLFYYRYFAGVGRQRLETLLNGRHVFITGGSKGMGYELAKICCQNGAHVTILARDKEQLERAKLELIKICPAGRRQNILAYSVDVAETKIFHLERAVTEAEQQSGPVYLLACCAGFAIARTFMDTSLEDFHRLMNVNYFGTVNALKAVLPSIKNGRGGHILMYSSIGGIFGLYGYGAYSGSKFAVVGLAQVLHMELKPDNITVTVAFPPDTATPGYEIEQIGKPSITQMISEEGGLFQPYQVSLQALKDCLAGEFISTTGWNSYFLLTMVSGIMPTKSWPKRLFQICFMGPLRIVGLHFLHTCENIIRKHGGNPPTVQNPKTE